MKKRWYGNINYKSFVFDPKINMLNKGFNILGNWTDSFYIDSFDDWVLIDDSNCAELKELMTKEAIKRGFVREAKIAKTGINKRFTSLNGRINGLYVFSNYLENIDSANAEDFIFHTGQWAEIEKPEPFLYAGKEGIMEIEGKKVKIKIIEEMR